MPEHADITAAGRPQTFGQRVQRARLNRGLTRAVVAGLVGKSTEWVKAIESGRLQTPRLPLLLHLADVLGIKDLAELTGDGRLAAASYTKAAHPELPAVKDALTMYQFSYPDDEPEPVCALRARVRQAWQMWHGSGDHRSRVAGVLPDLLSDLQHAGRVHEGTERRRVQAALAEAYHLAQLFLSYQPTPSLVTLTGDRAMTAAQDADSPKAIALAAWYMNHVFRDNGERNEARVDLAMTAADLLRPESDPEDLARWGMLHLAAALSYAKIGRQGDAERHWNRADTAARQLGDSYTHPYLIFGRGMVDAYAISIKADLVRGREAVQAAERVDVEPMPSATRRSFHMIEAARAYHLQHEPVAVMHLLQKAWKESPETAKYNLFTRATVLGYADSGPTTIRRDARVLRQEMGLPVTA